MSNSGTKELVFNSRERAVSDDWDRAQAFKGASIAEALAWLVDQQAGYLTSCGDGSIGTTTTSPMRAEILGGLLVRPQLGSANTLVDRGAVVMANPDVVVNPDDSPSKLVFDAGVTNGALLAMPANASGSVAIYIVECARLDAVLEVDNRDVFDPGSGTAVPTSVNKVVSSGLQYRIRAVALAGGVTFQPGWLPLLVALVPNGSTNWDNVTHMWDVRPLVTDRVMPASTTNNCGKVVRQAFSMINAPGEPLLRGQVDAVAPSGRMLGGDLSLDAGDVAIDLSSTLVLASAPVANTFWHLFLAEPYGLPRWCKYTSVGSGARMPGRLRGMAIVQTGAVQPAPVTNVSTGLNGPTGLGFPGTIVALGGSMVCVAGGSFDGAAAFILNFSGDGLVQWQDTGRTKAAAALTNTLATWNMSPGDDYPVNARAIWLRVNVQYNTNAANTQFSTTNIRATNNGAGTVVQQTFRTGSLAGQLYSCVHTVRVPIHELYPDNPGVTSPSVTCAHGGALAGYGGNPDLATLTVLGWEIR